MIRRGIFPAIFTLIWLFGINHCALGECGDSSKPPCPCEGSEHHSPIENSCNGKSCLASKVLKAKEIQSAYSQKSKIKLHNPIEVLTSNFIFVPTIVSDETNSSTEEVVRPTYLIGSLIHAPNAPPSLI